MLTHDKPNSAASNHVAQVKRQPRILVESPYNCFIFPLTQPQVANQQQKKIYAKVFQPVQTGLVSKKDFYET